MDESSTLIGEKGETTLPVSRAISSIRVLEDSGKEGVSSQLFSESLTVPMRAEEKHSRVRRRRRGVTQFFF